MEPLIRIESVPISIEMKTHSGRFERKSDVAELEIVRDVGGLSIRSKPIQLNIDTYMARNSVVPSTKVSLDQIAQKGIIAAQEATARLAREGQIMLQIHLPENPIPRLAAERANDVPEFGLGFLPETGPEIEWEPADLSIQYEMDKLNFEWNVSGGEFEFIPGDVEVNIKQYHDVVIEYVGEPLYVPPSSDPNYVPVDTKV